MHWMKENLLKQSIYLSQEKPALPVGMYSIMQILDGELETKQAVGLILKKRAGCGVIFTNIHE